MKFVFSLYRLKLTQVQRTPTEFGPPVSLITVSSRGQETREIDNLKLDTKICRVVVLDSTFGFP